MTCIIIHMLEHLILNGRLEAAYQYHQVSPRSFKEQLISHFNKGKRKQFLRLFILLRTEEKLEFYIRVYFLIYNIHPSIKPKGAIPEEEIAAFREFLETKGADLAKTNEFLQFYALSYVKKPLQHPSYKTLFKKEWINNLSEKLTLFIQQQEKRMKECSVNDQNEPKKSPQFRNSQPMWNSSLKDLQAKNKNLFEEVEAFKRKYHQLQRNNQALIESFNSHLMQSQNKWFQITRELTSNAKILVDLIARTNSNLIHDRRYQRIKKRTQKFEKIVKKELDELLNQSQDISVFDKPSANEISYSAASVTPNVSQRNLTTFVTLDEFIPTNYVGLIRDFKKMADSQKVAVLQGLSWRIIKSKNKWVRRQTIIGLVVNDVLGLVNGDIQLLMFNPTLTFNVLQLFLFISQDSYGRRVLFRNGGLYKEVIDLVPEVLKTKNYSCLDLILQILLNIWHNKDIYKELVNLNIIDICINSLLQNPEISANDSLLESIVTILLNATATEDGLNSFQYQINVFYYLSQAFREANDSNRNLIGAIMYALLGRKNLWKLAHQANLPNFIQDMLQLDKRSNKQQLKLIQSKLHTFQPGKTIDTEQLEDEESLDTNLQQQNFQRNQDQLQDLQQYIKGHQMLAAKYALRNKQAEKQLEQIGKIMNATEKNVPQHQPTKDNKNEQKQAASNTIEKQKIVHLPQIKKKKEGIQIFNPKQKTKNEDSKEYYSYKSPNFKQNQSKNVVSAHADRLQFIQEVNKPKVHSFEHDSVEAKRVNRVFTKPNDNSNEISSKKDQQRRQQERKSVEKPEYRIKKSNSVEKGLSNPYRKQGAPYQPNKNASNVADFKAIQGIKSPPPKKSREQVLKQLNQQLKAQKKIEEKERKLSNKNIPAANAGSIPRENTYLKKNNFIAGTDQEVKAFQSKPKIRRTPPQDEK